MNDTAEPKKRRLLATMTNEPFQPIRLYYSIPSRPYVIKKLRSLECMVEVPSERYWQWSFEAEAASLRFNDGLDVVPKELQPIVIGRIRFPKNGGMTLQANSTARAVEGARFFGPRFGPKVVAMRCRVINRCFSSDEGHPNDLMKQLEQDVTVIDPREAELAFTRDFKGVGSKQEMGKVAAEFLERKIKSREDVPMVEDFPLAPEEETPEFQHLGTALGLRLVRAFEHWQGNTHLTLTAIIMREVENGTLAGGIN